jgi:ribosomal protein S21
MATVVKAKPGEDAGSVVRRFKKQVLQDQILTILQEKRFHKSPSVIKKERKEEMARKRKRGV